MSLKTLYKIPVFSPAEVVGRKELGFLRGEKELPAVDVTDPPVCPSIYSLT